MTKTEKRMIPLPPLPEEAKDWKAILRASIPVARIAKQDCRDCLWPVLEGYKCEKCGCEDPYN